jgi:hypothetical protein
VIVIPLRKERKFTVIVIPSRKERKFTGIRVSANTDLGLGAPCEVCALHRTTEKWAWLLHIITIFDRHFTSSYPTLPVHATSLPALHLLPFSHDWNYTACFHTQWDIKGVL